MNMEPNLPTEADEYCRVAYGYFLHPCRKVQYDLYEAFERFTRLYEGVWRNHVLRGLGTDHRKLFPVLEKVLGEEAVARLFYRRDEALADEAFCAWVAETLREQVKGIHWDHGAYIYPFTE